MNAKNQSTALKLEPDAQMLSRRRSGTSHRERPKTVSVELFDGQAINIPFDHFELSPTGIYLHSDYLLCPGDEVTIGLKLSNCLEPLMIRGEVTRSETGNDGLRPGMSILFKEIARRERTELERFLIRRVVTHAR